MSKRVEWVVQQKMVGVWGDISATYPSLKDLDGKWSGGIHPAYRIVKRIITETVLKRKGKK